MIAELSKKDNICRSHVTVHANTLVLLPVDTHSNHNVCVHVLDRILLIPTETAL